MLALNHLPTSSLNSKPSKTSSILPSISFLKLTTTSSSPFLSNSIKTHESFHTTHHFPLSKSKLPSFFLRPTSHITKSSSSSSADISELSSKNSSKTFKLSLVFGLWYLQYTIFNIYYAKCLNIFPFPWFLASFQLLVGSIWMFLLWSFKLQPFPKITKPFIITLLTPALFHTIGHISASVSLSNHVINSSEPIFSVFFSAFLCQNYPFLAWLSILPIVFGCSLASISEFSFKFQGFWGAVISNVGFVLRNIYSKKSLQSFKEVNGLNFYGLISIISFIYLFPAAVFVEGSQWVQGYQKAITTIGKPMTFYMWVLIGGVFYHLYNQTSYQALDEISPLTFSVGNTMKTVVIIVSAVLVSRKPMRPLAAWGSGIAILGTFLYTRAIAKKKAETKMEGKQTSKSKIEYPILGFVYSHLKWIIGQIFDKLQGKEWRQKQIRKITDKVFNRVSNQTERASLSFEELYITVLIVYNDINKYLPGPHFDPPSKDKVRTLMQECDINLDGELNHEEFVKFIKEVTKDTFGRVSNELIISLVVAPTVAIATKRATEGVPGIGKVVQKLPVSIYASLVALAVVALQSANQGFD
ncbi:hypothetical protein RND81_03G191400 [Saponaria officinalis]|uniref:EF-hand domain-containing protein n=1 Tax=Saponaria officinalis TaxID=3572 RepID=A0AAW1M9M4_SAPOF